jgi:hypothetical protein
MTESERVGITPKSWTSRRHRGLLHLGKRWYVVSADVDDHGRADGVRLDGPYDDHDEAARHAQPDPADESEDAS